MPTLASRFLLLRAVDILDHMIRPIGRKANQEAVEKID